jgi:lysophospholipase L1-like esterase
VRWVTVYAPKLEEEVATVNDHLRRQVATHPNLDLIDWFAMVDEDPDLLSADGLHPDDGGQQALARAVAASTSSCA